MMKMWEFQRDVSDWRNSQPPPSPHVALLNSAGYTRDSKTFGSLNTFFNVLHCKPTIQVCWCLKFSKPKLSWCFYKDSWPKGNLSDVQDSNGFFCFLPCLQTAEATNNLQKGILPFSSWALCQPQISSKQRGNCSLFAADCLVQVYILHFTCLSHSLWVDDLILHRFLALCKESQRYGKDPSFYTPMPNSGSV